MDLSIRILTETANGSVKVASRLRCIAVDESMDLVIMHTPPMHNGKIPGYKSPIYTITGVENDDGATPQTVVAVFNEGLQMTAISEMSNDFCILLQIPTATDVIYLISMYCPKNVSMNSCLEKLQELLQFIADKQVILCIDSNAKSCWWSNSDNSDSRGEILEDFIIANSLCVLNRKDPLGQYFSRSDYTDVTLATNEIMQRFIAWQAHDDWTPGNARSVAMEVEFGDYSSQPIKRTGYISGDMDSDSNDTDGVQEDHVTDNDDNETKSKIDEEQIKNKTNNDDNPTDTAPVTPASLENSDTKSDVDEEQVKNKNQILVVDIADDEN